MKDSQRLASRRDVALTYMFVLGRPHENEERIDEHEGKLLLKLVSDFFKSSEFNRTVKGKLANSVAIDDGRNSYSLEISEWIKESFCLNDESLSKINCISSWSQLYELLFKDEIFTRFLNLSSPLFSQVEFNTLVEISRNPSLYRRIGDIDEVMDGGVRGWALDPKSPDEAGRVELWLDGAFIGSAPVDQFRRDLQDRYGGKGQVGFFIDYAGEWPRGRSYRLELKDQASGKLLKQLDRPALEPKPDRGLTLRNDLATAKRLLNSIEQRIRDEELLLANRLERYDLYYDQVYRDRRLNGPDQVTEAAHVIVNLGRASHRQLEQVLSALWCTPVAQSIRFSLIVSDPVQAIKVRDILARRGWGGLIQPTQTVEDLCCDSVASALARAQDAEVVVFAPAEGFVANGGLEVLLAPFAQPEVLVAYGDEDSLSAELGDYRGLIHTKPRLKPGFDPDLLEQTPYLGACLAVRSTLLHDLVPFENDLSLSVQALALKQGLTRSQIAHVERVIFTSFHQQDEDPKAEAWAQLVAPVLAKDVSVLPAADVLGVPLPDALRVKRPVQGRAAIIIPTRNGLDLLQPCVDSILKSLPHNELKAEIIIINHESDDEACLAYMEGLKSAGQARIIDYRGPFNWALMNNLAAQDTDAEVLVFLNNDTVVISPDWLDALGAQALRPEVGVVGARLLYHNATIQHAGFVWRDGNPGFLIHDGIGATGASGGHMGRHALAHACVAVTGACMALASDTFRALGGFDAANFPVECNDVDLCLRAADQGLRVLYEPAATLYHLESISRGFSRDGEKLKVAQEANAILFERWGQGRGRDPWFNSHFSREGRPFERLRPPQ